MARKARSRGRPSGRAVGRWPLVAWLLGAAAALGLAAALLAGLGRSPAAGPSIVLVLIDTLRADSLGCYGFPGDVSPHLDRLASDSIRFSRAYSQAPWTKPSIASLFTSLEPLQHGVLSHAGAYGDRRAPGRWTDGLPAAAETLAERLRARGYATAAFVANPWIQRRLGFAQGFQVFDHRGASNTARAGPLLRRALRWLDGRSGARPVFLYLHLMDVHGPYDAAETDFEAVRAAAARLGRRPLRADEIAALRRYLLRPAWVSRPEARRLETWRARYAAGVHAVDRELGAFLAELERRGWLDRAVVVVTADHGEELADHGGWDHGYRLYEEQLHVPLLFRLPGGRHGGAVADSVVSLIDLGPTLVSLAGGKVEGVPGRDLSALLADPGRAVEERPSFAAGVKWNSDAQSVHLGRYHLIVDPRNRTRQLFEVEADPRERRDLARAEPAVRARLERVLAAHAAELGRASRLAPRRVPVEDALRRRLEALGYVDRPEAKGPLEGGAGGPGPHTQRPQAERPPRRPLEEESP